MLASAAKLNAASPYCIGPIGMAQTVVVERSTDAKLTDPIEAVGVTVVRA